MNQDFSELIEYLDEKFQKIDGGFKRVDQRFQKIDERFEQIDQRSQQIDGRFGQIDQRFQKLFDVFATKEDLKEATEKLATKEDFNNLLNSVDTYAKKADTYFQEMVMLAHKVDRHEKWIRQIAEKLGVKLE